MKFLHRLILFSGILVSILLLCYVSVYIYTYYDFHDILFTSPSHLKHGENGQYVSLSSNEVGDSIGGILNPIVGFFAAILTFLAFYIQYRANKHVQDQFKIQQFESQFFKMLDLHKANVVEMSIEGYEYKTKISDKDSLAIYRFESMQKKKKDIYWINPKQDQDLVKKNIEGRKIFYLMTKEYEAVFMAQSQLFIALWSKNYALSTWCHDELMFAISRQKAGLLKIVLILLDETPIIPTEARGLIQINKTSLSEVNMTLNQILKLD